MTFALITGATAGIGAEFARQLATAGHHLVLVARDAERLEGQAVALRAEFGVDVEVLPADLHTAMGLDAVHARVARMTDPVDVLVNNAGYGISDSFDRNPLSEEERLLHLLVAVPLRLSHAALGQMVPRRSGTIINVSSVAAFSPRGTYGAAKAWVLSFSRWANVRYRRDGITVTAVAPGFVRTEFHERMKVRTDTIPAVLWLDAPRVVRLALRDVARGKAVSVPTVRYKFVVAVSRIAPARLAAMGGFRNR